MYSTYYIRQLKPGPLATMFCSCRSWSTVSGPRGDMASRLSGSGGGELLRQGISQGTYTLEPALVVGLGRRGTCERRHQFSPGRINHDAEVIAKFIQTDCRVLISTHGTGPGMDRLPVPCVSSAGGPGTADRETPHRNHHQARDPTDGAPAPRHVPQQYDIVPDEHLLGVSGSGFGAPPGRPTRYFRPRIRRTEMAPPHVLASPWRGETSAMR